MAQRPRGKPNTTVLPKEHSNKIPPNDILLYSEIRALLSRHQRSFLPQQRTNTETHSITQCIKTEKERDGERKRQAETERNRNTKRQTDRQADL